MCICYCYNNNCENKQKSVDHKSLCCLSERVHFSNSKNCLTRSPHTHTAVHPSALWGLTHDDCDLSAECRRQSEPFPVRSNEDKWPCLKRVELYVAERHSLWSCNVISNSLYWSCSDRLRIININLKSRVEYLFSRISSSKRSLKDLTQWNVSKVII